MSIPLNSRYCVPPAFLPLLITLFFTNLLLAQERYEAGYLIREDGTRQSVEIDNEDWRYNPAEITVRTGDAMVPVETTDLEEFGIPGKARFVNYTVTIEKSSDEPGRLSDTRPVARQERVLLRVEVEGPATLYSYRQPQVTKYFLQLGDTPPVQLDHSQWVGTDGRIMESSNFNTQLNSALKCGGKPVANSKNRYDLRELTRIVQTYNECQSDGASNRVYTNNAAGSQRLRFGITAGAYLSRFTLERSGLDRPFNEMERKVSFRVGAQLEYGLPFGNNKFALFLEPNYYRYSSSGEYDISSKLESATVEYSVVEVPLGLRYYSYFSDRLRGFANAAVGYNFVLSGELVPDRGQAYELGSTFSASGGLGLRYADHYSLEVRYQYDTDAFSEGNLKTKTGGFRLIVGYLF